MRLDFKKSNYALKKELKNMQPYDIAEMFYDLDEDEQIRVMQLIGVKQTSKVFSRLPQYQQIEVFEELDTQRKKQVLENLEVDELKEFISYYDEDEQNEILAYLKEDKANIVRDLLIYSNHLAPSIMTTEFLTINNNYTVKQATSYIFNNVRENDFIDNIYVLDDEEKVVGMIPLKELIIARPNDSLSKLIIDDYYYVHHDNTVKEAIEVVRNYDITSLAVTDYQGYLLGIITADDVLEQLITNYDELYNKLAFLPKHDDAFTGFQRSAKRLPWLILTTVINLAIAIIFLVIPAFEATLSQVFALVLFQPMVLAMAGNIGTQSLAVTILGIHKDELSTDSDRRRYFRKELMIVLLNAIMIAILGFLVVTTFAFLTKQVDKSGNPIPPYNLGLVVGASLFAGMTVSGMMGTSLPLLLTRHKVDADNAGGPVLTTLSDLIALFIYYLVVAIMLFVL